VGDFFVRLTVRAASAALLSCAFVSQTCPLPPASAATTAPLTRTVAAPVPTAVPTAVPLHAQSRSPKSVRHPFAVLDPNTVRPVVTSDVRRSSAIKMAGPPMLGAHEIDGPLRAAQERRRRLQSSSPQRQAPLIVQPQAPSVAQPQAPSSVQPSRAVPGPLTSRALPGLLTSRTSLGAVRTTQSVVGTDWGAGTGINPWWRYQEQNVPGGGHVMVNVGTGNYMLQEDDMSVPHKGIALAFRRTYNSQSGHNITSSDGGPAGLYGNGWTSTYDAHLTGDAVHALSVWDIDGARYDYTIASDGLTWLAPAGQHAQLTSDGGCGFLWTKKSGTTYHFYTPTTIAACPTWAQYAGYSGRIYQIVGRNRNITLTFSYGFDNGDTSASGKIGVITAYTESGLQATVTMADFSGHRLAYGLSPPSGAATYYNYDASGNLTSVGMPPNTAGSTMRYETYGYATAGNGASYLAWAASPRWYATSAAEGAYVYFGAAPLGTTVLLVGIGHMGYVNPTIADQAYGGNGGVLQPGAATGLQQFLLEYYTGLGTPNASFSDTDGHMATWTLDAAGRPVQSSECTASTNQGQQCTGTWLTTSESWDASNNLIATVEPRGNALGANPQAFQTDYAYDANGNTIAAAKPSTTSSQGTFRPTSLYDYDAYNNVTAYCDEIQTHAAGADWIAAPATSDVLCASHGGAHASFAFAYPSYQPYGRLTAMTTPLGYTRQIAYASGQQAGNDYGLPTSVTGSAFSQPDGTTITPAQSFWYDGHGNLRCYSKGQGTYVLSYDGLNRMTSVADPDDSSANAGSICGKTTGRSGWNTQTTDTYFPDGSKATTQTPAERAFGVSTTFAYDPDGQVTAQTDHHGCTSSSSSSCPGGTTHKWYDGADRLVQVAQPKDAASDTSPWMLRYIYDLSAGAGVAITGSTTFAAYGNLYKTQSLLNGWTDQRGSAFDALDREVQKFAYSITATDGSIGSPLALETTTLQYDAGSPATLGLVTKKTNPNNESVTYTYDSAGHKASETYAGENGVTPNETYLYDANGRAVQITSSAFGMQQYQYDADGRLTQSVEPSGGGVTNPAQISYAYLPDGQKSGLSVSSAHLNQSNIISYSYRADGMLQTQALNAFGGAVWNKTYTDAGRLLGITGIDIQSQTYDSSGQLSTYALRGGTVTFTHDPEGSVLTSVLPSVYQPGGGAPATETLTNTVNARGELYDQQWAPNEYSQLPHRHGSVTAGYMSMLSVPLPSDSNPDAAQPCTDYPDLLNGTRVEMACMGQDATYGTYRFPQGTDDTYTFDASGRAAKHVNTSNKFFSFQNPTTGSTTTAKNTTKTGTALNTYDAENHLAKSQLTVITKITDALTNQVSTTTEDQGTTTIGWGPNGHPALVDGHWSGHAGLPAMTLHWDGDLLLFVTDTVGNVIDFKVGLDGDVDPTNAAHPGPIAIERDAAGVALEYGDTTSFSGLLFAETSTTTAPTAGNPNFTGAASPYFQYNRPDGLSGTALPVAVNGVRAFDSTLGTWTTPDAFEGDPRAPASQQRYMWNRSNPFEYSDPSGYYPGQVGDAANQPYFGDTSDPESNTHQVAQASEENLLVQLYRLVVRGGSHGSEDIGTFSSEELLAEKFAKHGGEVGAKTESAYEDLARNLLVRAVWGRTGTEFVIDISSNGKLALKVFDIEKGRIGIYSTKGRVQTYYAMTKSAWIKMTDGLQIQHIFPPLQDL
jgi:YD repeat-containing protein